jgi:hypothetical protein
MSLSTKLLAQLRDAGLAIEPHSHGANEWLASTAVQGRGGGEVGPFESTEAALIGGVMRLVRLVSEAQTERDALWLELRQTRKALEAAQAELRAERGAKGGGAA